LYWFVWLVLNWINRHEVRVQRGTPFREEESRRREDPQEIPGQSARDRREGPEGKDWRFGQKEVFGSVGPDCRTVLFPHQKANPFETRRRPILLRGQCYTPYLRNDGNSLSGPPRRGLLPIHRLQRWVSLWPVITSLSNASIDYRDHTYHPFVHIIIIPIIRQIWLLYYNYYYCLMIYDLLSNLYPISQPFLLLFGFIIRNHNKKKNIVFNFTSKVL